MGDFCLAKIIVHTFGKNSRAKYWKNALKSQNRCKIERSFNWADSCVPRNSLFHKNQHMTKVKICIRQQIFQRIQIFWNYKVWAHMRHRFPQNSESTESLCTEILHCTANDGADPMTGLLSSNTSNLSLFWSLIILSTNASWLRNFEIYYAPDNWQYSQFLRKMWNIEARMKNFKKSF